MTLEPGDVIFTGTLEDVIIGQKPEIRLWLEHDERIGVMVEGLGELVTYIGEPSRTRLKCDYRTLMTPWMRYGHGLQESSVPK